MSKVRSSLMGTAFLITIMDTMLLSSIMAKPEINENKGEVICATTTTVPVTTIAATAQTTSQTTTSTTTATTTTAAVTTTTTVPVTTVTETTSPTQMSVTTTMDATTSMIEESTEIVEEPEVIVTDIPEQSYTLSPETYYYEGTYYTATAMGYTSPPYGAAGNILTSGYSVASNYFPFGTHLYISSDYISGEFVVEDCGGMANNVLDFYYWDISNVPSAFAWAGRIQVQVQVIE